MASYIRTCVCVGDEKGIRNKGSLSMARQPRRDSCYDPLGSHTCVYAGPDGRIYIYTYVYCEGGPRALSICLKWIIGAAIGESRALATYGSAGAL